jgi:hypothetical protein
MTNGHTPTENLTAAERALPEAAIRRSVIEPEKTASQSPGQQFAEILNTMAGAIDGRRSIAMLGTGGDVISPWGSAPTWRDRQLRALLPLEPYTMGAIGTIVATNAALGYKLDGPDAAVERTQDMLQSAQFGLGWDVWASKMSMDFYTQDKGAFSEVVRDFDSPLAEVIGLNQLDAAKCWHTGKPEEPVLYQDRLGRWHGLKWYQVITPSEMPTSHERLYGLQYCALTRILQITQILANVLQLNIEKTGGRHTRSVFIVNGVSSSQVEAAITLAQNQAAARGYARWMQPVIMGTTDPTAQPKLTEIALASVPDGFSEKFDDYFKWFMVAISLGLLRDYQEFAPLPGGGLGTSAQSEMLHRKTKGKGPALWKQRVTHLFNHFGIMPAGVSFEYEERDTEEDEIKGRIFKQYADAYRALVEAFIIDPEAARQMMVDNELMDQELFDEMNERDLTGLAPVTSSENIDAIERGRFDPRRRRPAQPDASINDEERTPDRAQPTATRESELVNRGMSSDFDVERVVV